MEARRLIPQSIVKVNCHLVANVDVYLRARPFSIDPYHRSIEAIRCSSDPRHVPIIVDCLGEANMEQWNREKEEDGKHRSV